MTMKVIYQQCGGVAGLVKRCELDTHAMPAAEAAELTRLAGAVCGADREAGSRFLNRAADHVAHDLLHYRITVDDGHARHCFVFTDLNVPDFLLPMLEFLVQRAR